MNSVISITDYRVFICIFAEITGNSEKFTHNVYHFLILTILISQYQFFSETCATYTI